MTFLSHSLVGGGLTGCLLLLGGGGSEERTVGYALGFVTGGLPDTLDWFLAWIKVTVRWKIYDWFHHHMPAWLKLILWQAWLHIELDKLVHRIPGYNWWPEKWYLEVGLWVIGGVTTWLSFA